MYMIYSQVEKSKLELNLVLFLDILFGVTINFYKVDTIF